MALRGIHATSSCLNTAPESEPRPYPSFASSKSVMLRKGRARLFQEGNPIVYGGAVQSVQGSPQTGEAVVVQDTRGNVIGWGTYNGDSMYRVRMLQTLNEMERRPSLFLDIDRTLEQHIHEAVSVRLALGLRASSASTMPGTSTASDSQVALEQSSAATTAFRLINSEGDGISGLIVDVFNTTAVVHVSAAWLYGRAEVIARALRSAYRGLSSSNKGDPVSEPATRLLDRMVWAPSADMLKLEGLQDVEQARAYRLDQLSPSMSGGGLQSCGLADAEGTEVQEVVVEHGLRYQVDPLRGQKTGFYCDQRLNRLWIRSIAHGKRVLDLCCYTGGFALNAASGGAISVVAVDSSAGAIAVAKRNSELNNLAEGTVDWHVNSIEKYMQQALDSGHQRSFDIVVLDPPKLCPNHKMLERSLRKYRKLNMMAMQLVKEGGILLTHSCSGAVTQSGSLELVVKQSAKAVSRRPVIVYHAGAAPCHVLNASYPEGKYLTSLGVACLM